jgi:hypothetical protein
LRCFFEIKADNSIPPVFVLDRPIHLFDDFAKAHQPLLKAQIWIHGGVVFLFIAWYIRSRYINQATFEVILGCHIAAVIVEFSEQPPLTQVYNLLSLGRFESLF